ncbi:MAG: UDP-N-acetylmuramoyl-L-alanine--D-glutamate ligase [Verrucomicrobia bacterium]|nr:UDP-N-acetylmuramoyl-L-alanine--D-glutamate ligase [Verrucomicrobiota bacterium]
MADWKEKKVLVLGLGKSGVAASSYLADRGATVCAIDSQSNADLERVSHDLESRGIEVRLGANALPDSAFDLAVVSPGVPLDAPLMQKMAERKIPVIGELELGFQESKCLNIAITGTNGKTTTTHLIKDILASGQRNTEIAGNVGVPISSLIKSTKGLDFLTLEVSSFQLETIRYFRPAIGVLLNLASDHQDRHESYDEYCRIKARLFENQLSHDWAIIQSEALAKLRSLGVKIPGKVITFSAESRQADVFLDRGLLISRMDGWAGPLLNLADCRVSGPHNAENIMAALLVGRVLRIPLEAMKAAVHSFSAPPHRCEQVGEINGVRFINDSKATNPHATVQALRSMKAERNGEPNVWLIAGGDDKGLQFHDLGPLISQKVKGAFLIGKAREQLSAAWSLFAPCQYCDDLVQAVTEAARKALPSDVVLLSPACSSLDMFRNYEHRGEVFRKVVNQLSATGALDKHAGSASNAVNPETDNRSSAKAS